MNMCGVHTKTIFNTKFLEIPEFCVNTHTLSLSLSLLKTYNHSTIIQQRLRACDFVGFSCFWTGEAHVVYVVET